MYVSGHAVVGVGEVHTRRRDVVQLLAGSGHRLGDVGDLQDLGPAERVICTARISAG
jgi:hypothetical protein